MFFPLSSHPANRFETCLDLLRGPGSYIWIFKGNFWLQTWGCIDNIKSTAAAAYTYSIKAKESLNSTLCRAYAQNAPGNTVLLFSSGDLL